MINSQYSLTKSMRRLITLCAFAAANHNLKPQVSVVSNVLPIIIQDKELLLECNTVLNLLLDK
ncbi:DUF1039 domain-containing protein [Providencia rettgeri]